MSPRRYDSSRRRAGAEATRARILEAALAILSGSGDLEGFSIESVAQKAGVARMTVYYQFRSRSELLDAVSDHLAERGGMQRMREVFMAPDEDEALRTLIGVFVGFWASDRVAMRRLRALGAVAPGLWGRARSRDAWRREAIIHLLSRFERDGRVARKAAREAEADLLSVLTSFETFDALCTDGRTPAQVTELLYSAALALLRTRSP